MMHTVAATNTTAGLDQVKAYLREFDDKIDLSTVGAVKAYFGISQSTFIWKFFVKTPFGEIKFHVLNAETPFLLYLQDMDRLGVYLNNNKNKIPEIRSVIANVIGIYNHSFLVWGPTAANFLTKVEPRRLHCRFNHPSVNRSFRTLKSLASMIHPIAPSFKIRKVCEYYQKYGRSPGRFKYTLNLEVFFQFLLNYWRNVH